MAHSVITAPEEWHPQPGQRSIFLAGGITGCEDWQAQAIDLLRDAGAYVLNPRRSDFDVNDPTAEDTQIEWEFRHLHRADVVLFWFPESPSPQPIALYELGRYGGIGKNIAVGTDPNYSRRNDVVKQTRLARPHVRVYDTLCDTIREAEALV